ncbi:MAG: FAD-dependent oxidoreductase [Rhodothermaceae bacterium]|nr:FAD-dependent oxidoreductase [Rhodothermaceae bacterium]
MTPDVVVLGAGIAGLTSAIRLAEAGFPVRMLARERPENTVSSVAAALWHPFRAEPPDRVLAWSRASYAVYAAEAADPDSGVIMRPLLELYRHEAPWPSWGEALPDLHRAPPPVGYTTAFAGTVPVIESPIYLARLEARLQAHGIGVEIEDVPSLDALVQPNRLVVVCVGLAARDLLRDDALYPIRGQVVRVTNPGVTRVLLDEGDAEALTYIIPRSADCILGGTTQEGVWDTAPDPAVTDAILARAQRLEPALLDAEVLEVRVGLRPGRTCVRLEAEQQPDGSAVIYNLGHGGSGYTLAWGCADEVVASVQAFAGSRRVV